MQKPVRCGVLGVGWMGSIRVEHLAALPEAELVACADPDPAARERVPADVPVLPGLDQLLACDLDALLVCTPDGLHVEAVLRGLDAGLDVLCEKPLAATLADARTLADAAATASGRLVVGHSLRAEPRYRALRARVASGQLGPPVHLASRRAWPLAEGRRQAGATTLARYLSVHEVDVLAWVAGAPIVRVHAERAAAALPGLVGEGSLVATFRFANGAVASHECTWALPDQAGLELGDCALRYVGTRGIAALEVRDDGLLVLGGVGPDELPDDGVPRGAIERPDGRTSDLVLSGDLYAIELAAFLRGRDGSGDLITVEEAVRAVAVVEAIEESLASGQPVDVAA